MMKFLLAISLVVIALNSADGGVLIIDGFTEVYGWTFYKVKVKGSMTNFNVQRTCDENNLKTPCYAGTYDTFNSDQCDVVFNKEVTEDADTMQFLSINLCNHREPEKCEVLKDLFIYKENWAGDSACGATEANGYCAYGEAHNNLWALCAASKQGARVEDETPEDPEPTPDPQVDGATPGSR